LYSDVTDGVVFVAPRSLSANAAALKPAAMAGAAREVVGATRAAL
jgi:hypothetical protein